MGILYHRHRAMLRPQADGLLSLLTVRSPPRRPARCASTDLPVVGSRRLACRRSMNTRRFMFASRWVSGSVRISLYKVPKSTQVLAAHVFVLESEGETIFDEAVVFYG